MTLHNGRLELILIAEKGNDALLMSAHDNTWLVVARGFHLNGQNCYWDHGNYHGDILTAAKNLYRE